MCGVSSIYLQKIFFLVSLLAGFHAPDVLGETLSFLGLAASRPGALGGQWAGVHHQKAHLCHVEVSISVFHQSGGRDTGPAASVARVPGVSGPVFRVRAARGRRWPHFQLPGQRTRARYSA